jgi:ABC-type Fe3+ transport system substrate-binding protein
MNTGPSRRGFVAGLAASSIVTMPTIGRAADNADWQAGAPAEWDRIMKAAQAEGQVTVAAFPSLAEKMSAAFKRDTGIQVNFLAGNAAEQSARLEAEARAKNLTIDILIGGGRELGAMMHDGLLQPVLPQLLLPGVAPANFRGGRIKWMDSAERYNLQGSEYVFGWLIVNQDIVKPTEIKSWKDLLDPKYTGRIGSYDLVGPGPGQGSATWIYTTFGIDYIKALFIDQKVKFSVDNRGLVEEVVRGTTPIVFGAIQSEVERFKRDGFTNLAVVLPDDAPGYLTGGYSVLKQAVGVPHPNAATIFINWYVSKPGQEVYESVMLETSRRIDVNTGVPDYLVPRPGVTYYEAFNEKEYFARYDMVKVITAAIGR